VITRDDAVHPSPPTACHGQPRPWASAAEETVVVGDFLLDMLAGAAGAVTAYLTNGDGAAAVDSRVPESTACDFVGAQLAELDAVARLAAAASGQASQTSF